MSTPTKPSTSAASSRDASKDGGGWVTDYTRISIGTSAGVVGTYDHKAGRHDRRRRRSVEAR
ncbi:MAG: hypothetical protein JJU00_19625 [Opitutales bacterium]|nr:hypothetical protein [Opitutales bacterium]